MTSDKTIKRTVNETSDSALKRGGNEEKAPDTTENAGTSSGSNPDGPRVESKDAADSKSAAG